MQFFFYIIENRHIYSVRAPGHVIRLYTASISLIVSMPIEYNHVVGCALL